MGAILRQPLPWPAAHLQRRNPQEVVAILPADHVIQDSAAFQRALLQAQLSAQIGYLTVLGIEPQSAHTGYGYIKRAAAQLPVAGDRPTFAVESFLEKPDLATAEQFWQMGVLLEWRHLCQPGRSIAG